MRRLRITAGMSVLAVVLVLSASAGAAGSPVGKVKQTAASIWTLAMDGPRVAYASAGRIYVWDVATGATSVVKGSYSNARHTYVASELAIAGSRVAWIKRQDFGNTEMGEKLFTAAVPGRARRIAQGYIFGRETSAHAVGHWIAGVAGSGTVLAVSTWKSDDAATSNEKLSLITTSGLRPIARGPGAIVAAAVNSGHIAVLRSLAAWPADDPSTPTSEPTVGIYSAGGKLLREIVLDTPVPPQPPCPDCGPDVGASTMFNSLALSGSRLVVLTQTNPETPGSSTYTTKLEVYDWTTGTLLQTWPIALTPYSGNVPPALSAYGRLAAVQGRNRLQLIDLTTGQNATIPTAGAYRAMALDARGLVYAASGQGEHGKLVFVPIAKALALVS
jgi:hypothetical protein